MIPGTDASIAVSVNRYNTDGRIHVTVMGRTAEGLQGTIFMPAIDTIGNCRIVAAGVRFTYAGPQQDVGMSWKESHIRLGGEAGDSHTTGFRGRVSNHTYRPTYETDLKFIHYEDPAVVLTTEMSAQTDVMGQLAAGHVWTSTAVPAVVHPILVHLVLLYDTKGIPTVINPANSGDFESAGLPQQSVHVDSAPHQALSLRHVSVPHNARHDKPSHPESKKHWYDVVKSVGKDLVKGVENISQAAGATFGAYGAYSAAQIVDSTEATAWAAEPLLLTL